MRHMTRLSEGVPSKLGLNSLPLVGGCIGSIQFRAKQKTIALTTHLHSVHAVSFEGDSKLFYFFNTNVSPKTETFAFIEDIRGDFDKNRPKPLKTLDWKFLGFITV